MEKNQAICKFLTQAVFVLVYNIELASTICHVQQQKGCLEGSVFYVIRNIGVQQCIKQCRAWTICKSINHKRSSLSCELYSGNTTSQNISFVPNDDCTYIEVNDADISLVSNPCQTNMCSNGEMCVIIKDGSAVCIAKSFKLKLQGANVGSTAAYVHYSVVLFGLFAIDGNRTTFYHSVLMYSDYPYWWIELNNTVVKKVTVFKRDYNRFYNVTMYSGLTLNDLEACDTFHGPTNDATATFTCSNNKVINYIKFIHRGSNTPRILIMAEVIVYGWPIEL